MNLIERLIAKGWRPCRADGAYSDTAQVCSGAILVSFVPAAAGGLSWALMTSDLSDATHIVEPTPTEQALLHSRVGAVTVAAILGEPEPSVDDVIRDRLVAAGWERDRDGFVRDGFEVHETSPCGAHLSIPMPSGRYGLQSADDLLTLMRAPFGSVTVAEFCGIDVSDLEVPHE